METQQQSFFTSLVYRLLPRHFQELPSEMQRKTLLTAQFGLAFAGISLLYSPVYVVFGIPLLSVISVFIGFASLANVLYLKRGGSVLGAASFILLLLDGLIIALTYVIGGDKSPIWMVIVLVPVIAILLISSRAGLVWAFIVIAQYSTFWILGLLGTPFDTILPPAFIPYFPIMVFPAVIGLLVVIVLLFEKKQSGNSFRT